MRSPSEHPPPAPPLNSYPIYPKATHSAVAEPVSAAYTQQWSAWRELHQTSYVPSPTAAVPAPVISNKYCDTDDEEEEEEINQAIRIEKQATAKKEAFKEVLYTPRTVLYTPRTVQLKTQQIQTQAELRRLATENGKLRDKCTALETELKGHKPCETVSSVLHWSLSC